MYKEALRLLGDMNQAIIKFRGVYSACSKKHNISYNEMLVLYTIRDNGFCTQKQICESYLLPRQTMNYVMNDMRARGLLAVSRDNDLTHRAGREKRFVLTEKGKEYAGPLLDSLTRIERQAVERIGREHLRAMADSVLTYSAALQAAIEEDT